MRISLQVQYAIAGLFDLAYNGHGRPIQVRVVSERQGIPSRYLEQIFQRLRRARLVQGKRGPGGGYQLARPPGEITLRDVVEALEGPAARWIGPVPRSRGSSYRPAFLWPRLSGRFADVLDAVSLESLCRDAARSGVRRAHADSQMYFI